MDWSQYLVSSGHGGKIQSEFFLKTVFCCLDIYFCLLVLMFVLPPSEVYTGVWCTILRFVLDRDPYCTEIRTVLKLLLYQCLHSVEVYTVLRSVIYRALHCTEACNADDLY